MRYDLLVHPTAIWTVDGLLLLATSLMLLAIAVREYHGARLLLRAAIFSASFFALASSLHMLGLRFPSVAWPYWAKIGLDASIATAAASRLFFGHFAPRPPH